MRGFLQIIKTLDSSLMLGKMSFKSFNFIKIFDLTSKEYYFYHESKYFLDKIL